MLLMAKNELTKAQLRAIDRVAKLLGDGDIELGKKLLEQKIQGDIGSRAYLAMAKSLGKGNIKRGKEILAEKAREQGEVWKKLKAEGKPYHRPKVYGKPCIFVNKRTGERTESDRHRFDAETGICKQCKIERRGKAIPENRA